MLVKKQHLSELVADKLQTMIIQREYELNDRLPSERDLAKQLNVSRNVVREAIKLLQERGMVKVQSGSGVYISAQESETISRSVGLYVQRQNVSVTHVFEVRWILETENARLAAQRAIAQDIQLLDDCLRRSKDAMEDPVLFTSLDIEFHRLLALSTGNPVLPLLLDTIVDTLSDHINRTSNLPGAQENAFRHHTAIFDAVRRHNPEEARAAMVAHLESSRVWLSKVIPEAE
ncbi:MAG: FadR/GntR family transcriptional regulator [Anaerolineae bacterium]